MGIATSPRGRARQARTVDGEILRMLSTRYPLQSLTALELDLDRHPVTRPAQARPVWGWVRYGDTPVRVAAELCGWTASAAALRWEVPGKGIDRAWVWGSCVELRDTRPPAGE